MAKELQAEAWREVLALLLAAALRIDRARPEGVVELLRRPGPGMQRAGDELPERVVDLAISRIGRV